MVRTRAPILTPQAGNGPLFTTLCLGRAPLTGLAVELADHLATCPVCRPGNMAACPQGLALVDAFAAQRDEVLADEDREDAEPQG